MSEDSKIIPLPAPASVPGVSAGATPVAPVAGQSTPVEVAGQVSPASPAKFGGNPTGRTRKDGLKPGSPEALEADRVKNRERMAAKRALERAAAPPPVLPAPPSLPPGASPGATSIPVVDGAPDFAPVSWTADDFKQVAPDTIELIEQWRVSAKIELAESGKLSAPVVQQIAKDAAFPAPAKRSLQSSSPAAVAKLFNALNVPIAFKPYISTCPTLVYLVLRDWQQTAEIKKIIATERERTAVKSPAPEAKG